MAIPVLLGFWIGGATGLGRLPGLLIGMLVAAAGIWWMRRGRRRRDVARDMLEVAASVGEVTGVPLVLMGHSHHGTLQREGDVVYANSGSWLDGSHLYVRRDTASSRLVEVELRRWRNGGISRVETMAVPQPALAVEAAIGELADQPA